MNGTTVEYTLDLTTALFLNFDRVSGPCEFEGGKAACTDWDEYMSSKSGMRIFLDVIEARSAECMDVGFCVAMLTFNIFKKAFSFRISW